MRLRALNSCNGSTTQNINNGSPSTSQVSSTRWTIILQDMSGVYDVPKDDSRSKFFLA
jgi:hypothetical protein